jgi:hypothetical protein
MNPDNKMIKRRVIEYVAIFLAFTGIAISLIYYFTELRVGQQTQLAETRSTKEVVQASSQQMQFILDRQNEVIKNQNAMKEDLDLLKLIHQGTQFKVKYFGTNPGNETKDKTLTNKE